MVEVSYKQDEADDVVVELRDPYWAAFLAWLWPGAGHFYQRRFGKGFLFMICVLGTFFVGLGWGRGRVVYASFKPGDFRWQYICQLGAGAVALPAAAQAFVTSNPDDPTQPNDPFFVLAERYPAGHSKEFLIVDDENYDGPTLKDGFMAPPAGPIYQDDRDTLGMWHYDMQHMYDIATLYCVVAGLLNMLVVYDAFCGPAIITPEQRKEIEEKRKRKSWFKKRQEND